MQSPVKNLSVAPSRIALAKLEAKLIGEIDAHFKLKDKLEPIRKLYPQIVIDCPPTLGLLTVNALVAATHLLIPIQSSYFALEGTDDLLETIEKVRQRPNPSLQILGVVITMHDKRTSLAKDIRMQIKKVFGGKVFKTVITKSVRLEESPAYKESIFTYAPGVHRRERVLQSLRGGHRSCLGEGSLKPSGCGTTLTTSRRSRPRLVLPSAV